MTQIEGVSASGLASSRVETDDKLINNHKKGQDEEKTRDALLRVFQHLLIKKSDISLDESGLFVAYGRMSYVEQKLLADANSELARYIDDAYRQLLKTLDDSGRSEIAEAVTKHGGNILHVLMAKDSGFPNIFALFEIAKRTLTSN